MKAQITIRKTNEILLSVEMDHLREYSIGRDPTCDFHLADAKISRRHAILRFNPFNKNFEIQDLDSLNGCHLNGTRIQSLSSLQSGDEIRIGDFFLTIELENSKENQHPEKPTDSTGSLAWLSDDAMKTTGQLLNGKLGELGLPDVLQMLAGMRKTGLLILSDEKIQITYSDLDSSTLDKIFLKNGEIVDARRQKWDGEEALFEILELKKGYFALYPMEFEKVSEFKIQSPLQFLLLESARRSDERQREDIHLEDTDNFQAFPHDDLKDLDRDSLEVLQLAWKLENWKAMKSAYKKPLAQLEEITRQLIRKSYLRKSTR